MSAWGNVVDHEANLGVIKSKMGACKARPIVPYCLVKLATPLSISSLEPFPLKGHGTRLRQTSFMAVSPCIRPVLMVIMFDISLPHQNLPPHHFAII